MIYISTGGYRSKSAYETSLDFIEHGISYIELSGGLYDGETLKNIKTLTSATFQIHNYFPPPKKPFVLNLASLDEEIARISIDHVKKAIRLSTQIGQSVYSLHAGFLLDPTINELGRNVPQRPLFDRNKSLLRFVDRVNRIDTYAQSLGVKILLENNVLSANNYRSFKSNPFLMATADECIEVMKQTSNNVNLLVDVAHLKVTANSLKFSPVEFLHSCDNWIRAYHLSDNDGTEDNNRAISDVSWFWPHLKRDLHYYSLEVYGHTPVELVHQRNLAIDLLGLNR
jgi:sugar phosphate isomerase/epimerase